MLLNTVRRLSETPIDANSPMAFEQKRYRDLLETARLRFDPDLLPGETRVLENSVFAYSLSATFTEAPRKTVRPAFLRWMLTDHEVQSHLDPAGVWIVSGIFTAPIELTDLHISFAITFVNCEFGAGLLMFQSSTRGIHIKGCTASNVIDFSRIICEGVITIAETQCTGLRFLEAHLRSLYISNTSVAEFLDLSSATIEGVLGLSPGFTSHGQVLLIGTVVRGFVSALGAQLMGKKDSLVARRCVFGSDLSFVETKIRDNCLLSAINVTGDCNFTSCSFGIEGGSGSLFLQDATVAGDILLELCSCARGTVDVTGTQVKGSVSCYGAAISCFRGLGLTVGKDFSWLAIDRVGDGSLILDGAAINILRDDEESWPVSNQLSLRRATFNKLIEYLPLVREQVTAFTKPEELSFDALRRVTWLERQNNLDAFDAHIWQSLAAMVKASGDLLGAKRVVLAQRKHQAKAELVFARRAAKEPPMISRVRWILRRTLAVFEREPLLILIVILALTLFGTSVFWPLKSRFSPTGEAAYKASYSPLKGSVGDQPPYPKFSPLIYSLENALPVIRLGQDDKWAPNYHLCSPCMYLFLTVVRWFLILAGWSQATILATVVGDRFLNKT